MFISGDHVATLMKSAEQAKQNLDVTLGKLANASDRLDAAQNEHVKKRTKRLKNPTTFELVHDHKSSTRYRRRCESKDVMEFIHGGQEGAVYGAWDLLLSLGSNKQVEHLITNYKKGRFLQGHFNTLTKKFESSDIALRQALVLKYNNYLSTRKYRFQCKTLNSLFDPDKETWIPRNKKVSDGEFCMPKLVSLDKLDKFAKNIDIGHVNLIPGGIGVSRTLVSLVIMIADLHLRLPYLTKRSGLIARKILLDLV